MSQSSGALAPVKEVEIESWTLYSVAIMCVGARMTAVAINIGRLEADDIIMLLAVIPYTVLIVTSNIVAGANTNELEPGQLATLSSQEIQARIYGSKVAFIQEESMIHTLWFIKICLIILYNRATKATALNKVVRAVGVYVGCSYVLLQVLFLGVWCRPINQYWAVPPNNEEQCASWTHHLITQACLNLSSDLIIISLPISLVLKTTLTWQKKLGLVALFGLGSFVILCAVLNKYWNLSDPASPQWLYWYVRESSTAMVVSNILLMRPLYYRLRNVFRPKRDSFSGSTLKSSPSPSTGGEVPKIHTEEA